MNDRDCCIEEQARLIKERSALQLWFNEEWRVVNAAIEHSEWLFHQTVTCDLIFILLSVRCSCGTSVEFEET